MRIRVSFHKSRDPYFQSREYNSEANTVKKCLLVDECIPGPIMSDFIANQPKHHDPLGRLVHFHPTAILQHSDAGISGYLSMGQTQMGSRRMQKISLRLVGR